MPRFANAQKESVRNSTRKKLLKVATMEFANKGFGGANINHISIAAGYATGTVYNYFPSKRALMLTLIDEIDTHHSSFIKTKVVGITQPEERIQAFCKAGFNFVEKYPEQAQVTINAGLGFDLAFKERIYQAYQSLFDLLIDDIIGFGVIEGEFKPTKPDSAAALLMSICLGGSSLYNPDGGVWFNAKKVTTFVMDGIRAQKSTTESDG